MSELIARYPLRGIKGPVGTGQDMLDLVDGDAERLADAGDAGSPTISASRTCSSRPARSIRARWTTTW